MSDLHRELYQNTDKIAVCKITRHGELVAMFFGTEQRTLSTLFLAAYNAHYEETKQIEGYNNTVYCEKCGAMFEMECICSENDED